MLTEIDKVRRVRNLSNDSCFYVEGRIVQYTSKTKPGIREYKVYDCNRSNKHELYHITLADIKANARKHIEAEEIDDVKIMKDKLAEMYNFYFNKVTDTWKGCASYKSIQDRLVSLPGLPVPVFLAWEHYNQTVNKKRKTFNVHKDKVVLIARYNDCIDVVLDEFPDTAYDTLLGLIVRRCIEKLQFGGISYIEDLIKYDKSRIVENRQLNARKENTYITYNIVKGEREECR